MYSTGHTSLYLYIKWYKKDKGGYSQTEFEIKLDLTFVHFSDRVELQ